MSRMYNKAKSGTFTILSTENSYLLEFDQPIYDLVIDFENQSVSLTSFKIKINDGDLIKLYSLWPVNFDNVEIYKIEFIKQETLSQDITVYYQGFIKK